MCVQLRSIVILKNTPRVELRVQRTANVATQDREYEAFDEGADEYDDADAV